MALQGFDFVRAYSSRPEASEGLLEALNFERRDGGWEARGDERGGFIAYDTPPAERGLQGAGRSTTSPGHRRWRSMRPGAGW